MNHGDPTQKKYLVLWSGGLRSTWTLYFLLSQTGAAIHAHHVNLMSRGPDGLISRNHDTEKAATRAMQSWLADHVRRFPYSESFVDLTAFEPRARDEVVCLYLGAQAAMSWGFLPSDSLMLGNGEDISAPGERTALVENRRRFRALTYRRVVEAVLQSERVPEVSWIMPTPSRAQQIADLPDQLLDQLAGR